MEICCCWAALAKSSIITSSTDVFWCLYLLILLWPCVFFQKLVVLLHLLRSGLSFLFSLLHFVNSFPTYLLYHRLRSSADVCNSASDTWSYECEQLNLIFAKSEWCQNWTTTLVMWTQHNLVERKYIPILITPFTCDLCSTRPILRTILIHLHINNPKIRGGHSVTVAQSILSKRDVVGWRC